MWRCSFSVNTLMLAKYAASCDSVFVSLPPDIAVGVQRCWELDKALTYNIYIK